MPHFINFNGIFLEESTPIVAAGNRALRYGDGVFETMKLVNGEIKLNDFHFERLFNALSLLQFRTPQGFSIDYLQEQILSLCTKNLLASARVRLNVFRKNGGLYDLLDHTPNFVIEAGTLPQENFTINDKGLVIGLYDKARKSFDTFSHLKSNNYLPYTMGALYAEANDLDDCMILNSNERICEATIANVFWVRDNAIFTPPLSEGCVAGVMRRHLLNILPLNGYSVQEQPLTVSELKNADEVFLTNAVSGIRWVEKFQDKAYTNAVTASIFSLLS
jgi:branched-chain amino acid aminotransferase